MKLGFRLAPVRDLLGWGTAAVWVAGELQSTSSHRFEKGVDREHLGPAEGLELAVVEHSTVKDNVDRQWDRQWDRQLEGDLVGHRVGHHSHLGMDDVHSRG